MDILSYPFDVKLLNRKKRAVKRELLEKSGLIEKRIAVLGGSTTHDVIEMMELFLLDNGIRPVFYESEYAQYWEAIPTVAFNVANIVKSLFGKNKKALALDLDNTLWGGIVGDDGPENLELGTETAVGQAYTEFQEYLKNLRKQGVLLNVISKNEEAAARSGLKHPQMILNPEDFISIKANWEPKSQNLVNMAKELSLLPEAFVFVDDN